VKLKTQRKTTKKVSTTKPKACNPYGPTRILEAAEFSILASCYELFKSIPERASSQNIAANTIAIGRNLTRFTKPHSSLEARDEDLTFATMINMRLGPGHDKMDTT
jgi:hypothetical protein